MANFQCSDACGIAVARLQLRNRLPPVAPRRTQGIECGVITLGDIAALPGIGRRRGNERPRE